MQKYYSPLRFLYDKTPKRPNAQTPKRLLAVLLCLLVLYGCKRQLLDPLNPQNNLPEKVKLDKVKGFYENGRYKNQPKRTSGNERMTAADSARFKDFEPQWDKTVVELLPNNEKMLIVPVVRNLQVNYNQDIGFIRRLCIHVDANEDFLEANIVELVGNLTFVKENHNAIFKDYKENNISGFSGVMATYDLSYNRVITEKFENGVSNGQNAPQDLILVGSGGCIIVYSDAGVVVYDGCSNGGVGNGGTGGGLGGTGTGSGGTGSGGTGGSGTGGTGGTGNNPTYACRCPGGSHCCGSGACNSLGIPATLPGYTPPTSPPVITPPYVYVPPTQGNPYPTNTYPGTNPNTGTGGGGYNNGEGALVPLPKNYPSQTPRPPNTPRPPTSTTPRPTTTTPIPPMPFPGMVLGDDLNWYFPDGGVSWSWGDEYMYDADGNFIYPLTEEQRAQLQSLDSLSAGLIPADRVGQMPERSRVILAETLLKLRKSSPIYEKMYQLLRAQAQLPNNDNRSIVFKRMPYLQRDNGSFVETYGVGTMRFQSDFLTNPSTVGEEFMHALDDLVAHKAERLNPSYTQNRVNGEMDAKTAMQIIRALGSPNAPAARSLFEDYSVNLNVILPNKTFDVTMDKWIKTLPSPFPASFTPTQMTEYFYYMDFFKLKQQNLYNFTGPRSNEQPKLFFLLFR